MPLFEAILPLLIGVQRLHNRNLNISFISKGNILIYYLKQIDSIFLIPLKLIPNLQLI
jgi:hypothetical protein